MTEVEQKAVKETSMTFNKIKEKLENELDKASTADDVENLRIRYLGRKGIITNATKEIDFSTLSAEERRKVGQELNELKSWAQTALQHKKEQFNGQELTPEMNFDLTIPGHAPVLGKLHPIRLVQLDLEYIFRGMGFRVLTGNEVETEYYNFDALNIPSDHPAREMQDTYWLTNGDLLRTHTSATQVRALKEFGVPLRAIFPGRVFRYEAVDASHENTFYQLEGLLVDEDITVAHLIGVMKELLKQVFGRTVEVRLRPGFFPFVEPGFELDFRCALCDGQGCSTCKNTGWIELMPCGLVHPRVLEHGGVDSEKYSGFAFGCGLTRLAMMKFHIPYIRLFNCGDLRFYEQFPARM